MRSPGVFVSRPALLTGSQQALDRAWSVGIATLGFAEIAIAREAYAPLPWEQLRGAIREADGALILGFRQLSVGAGLWRTGTPDEASANGWYPTPWNQLEAGLAIMAGLPVLVAPEEGVVDGVFSSDILGGSVHGVPIDIWAGDDARRDPALQAWTIAVRRCADLHGLSDHPLPD
jgi:hypothetical protein